LASGAVVTFAQLHEIVSRGLAFFNQIVGIGRRGLLFKQILPEEKVLGRVAKPFDFALVSVVVKQIVILLPNGIAAAAIAANVDDEILTVRCQELLQGFNRSFSYLSLPIRRNRVNMMLRGVLALASDKRSSGKFA